MPDEAQPDNIRREIIARAAEEVRGERRNLLNLLITGHGAALLLIFNARASVQMHDLDNPVGIALVFVVGLICAFAAAHNSMGGSHSELMAVIKGVHRTDEQEARRERNATATRGLFVLSAGCFIAGLLWAITVLG